LLESRFLSGLGSRAPKDRCASTHELTAYSRALRRIIAEIVVVVISATKHRGSRWPSDRLLARRWLQPELFGGCLEL
jgi:hypothetical protein